MTPSEREEIEKVAQGVYADIMDWVDNDGMLSTDSIPMIAKAILTQVEKARAEQREKIAVYLEGTETWEGREFAKAIRNKLNQQGE